MAARRYRPEDLPDPRNAEILVHVDGELVPRDEARVSVFDSSVQGGDAVWEGLRVYDGKIYALDRHLDRLFASAHALRFEGIPSRDEVRNAVVDTFTANGMYDGAHARLTLTRGPKMTSGMTPMNNRAGCTLIVLAEWKPPVYGDTGIRLITSSVRRNSPATLDSKIHHNNLLNNILAKIEADVAGADDALMLDLQGFVAETNATNIFLVRNGVLVTASADACLPGITRGIVLELAGADGMRVSERNVSLSEVYTADEVFTTGTMGELTPVLEVDGRTIGTGETGPITKRLRDLHRDHTRTEGEPLPT
ncbi:MAG: aminotransferase class IV [Actinomycetota bacterium]|nr:aminotransferase class IV [Actinomycetota bacterium]